MTARGMAAGSAATRQTLSRQSIVEAALELVRRQGAAKLSMRSLAAELGVTPMAIYYHVPDKDGLLDLLAEEVVGSAPTHAPSGEHWEQELRDHVIEPWLRLAAYPGLAAALIERPPPKRSREYMRYGISILTAAGFDARTATLAVVSLQTYMFGVVSMQLQLSKFISRERQRRAAGGVTKSSRRFDLREIVESGVETMVAGLRTRRCQDKESATAKGARRGKRKQQVAR